MNGETHESKMIGGRESQDGHAEGVLCKGEVLMDVGLVSMTCRAMCISLALMAVPSKRSASPSKSQKHRIREAERLESATESCLGEGRRISES